MLILCRRPFERLLEPWEHGFHFVSPQKLFEVHLATCYENFQETLRQFTGIGVKRTLVNMSNHGISIPRYKPICQERFFFFGQTRPQPKTPRYRLSSFNNPTPQSIDNQRIVQIATFQTICHSIPSNADPNKMWEPLNTIDYYSIFGIPPDAKEEEISRAYRKLALRMHPDKNKSPNATASFQKMSNAWQVLKSPTKRASYDRERPKTQAPQAPKPTKYVLKLK